MSDVIKLGGYHGGGAFDGHTVMVTSGGANIIQSPGYLDMVAYPKDGAAGRVIHSDGTKYYEAQMTFELLDEELSISNFLERGHAHTFKMGDGYNGVTGSGCYITSASFSAQTGGIVSCNVTMITKSNFTFSSNMSQVYTGEDTPKGYWLSGGDGKIASWSLSMQQDAKPMYANKDETEPHYIQVLGVSYSLTVESYTRIEDDTDSEGDASIDLSFGDVTLHGSINNAGYSFGGPNALGTYTYTFETGSDTGNNNKLVISAL